MPLNYNYFLSLEKLGYEVFSLFVARELREKIGKMSNAIYNSGKFNCKHSDKMWSNLALNKILDETLSKNIIDFKVGENIDVRS